MKKLSERIAFVADLKNDGEFRQWSVGVAALEAEVERLRGIEQPARIALDLLDRITASFPDNATPHPSIEECLHVWGYLNAALAKEKP